MHTRFNSDGRCWMSKLAKRNGNEVLVTAGKAARQLGYSVEWVRELSDRGVIECTRDSNGCRLYEQSDIDALATKLKSARADPGHLHAPMNKNLNRLWPDTSQGSAVVINKCS